MPAIGADLQAEASGLQWIVNAYLLPLSALLLLGGAAGDKFGRRRLFLLGIALFALASALCALAPSLPLLLAGRALQGIASAMLMPNSLALLGAAFAGEARGRAIGTWAAAGAIAGALGPLLGGWLVESVGWRAIFLINLPLCAAALWLGWRYVAESREEGGAPLDALGVAVATLGLGAVTWGLTELSGGGRRRRRMDRDRRRSGRPPRLPGDREAAGRTGDHAARLVRHGELRRAHLAHLLPLRRSRRAVRGPALRPDRASGLFAGRRRSRPPAAAGGDRPRLAADGRVAARTGPRLPLTVGPLIVAAGFALAARIGGGGSYWTTVMPAVLVIAIGMAGAVAPLTTAVMASVDRDHVGTANGFNSAVARTGSLIATALLGAVLAARGEALASAFAVAAFVAAGAAALAGLAALILLKPHEMRTPSSP